VSDASTLGARLSAARAVTTSQKTGNAPAASSTPAATSEASSTDSTSTEATTSSTPTVDSVIGDKVDAKTEDKSSDDGDNKPKTPEELTKAFTSLDKREKKFKTKRREWEASVKEKDAEFAKAKQELISEHSRITALQRSVQEKHAWVVKGQQAWDNSDPVEFAKAIEKMAKGASLAAITRWLAGAAEKPAAAQSQPDPEREAFAREKAEWERQRAAEAAKGDDSKKQREQAKQREEAKGRLAQAFAKHAFLVNPDDPKNADPDALNDAFEAVAKAMKHRRPGETAKVVAKRTLDELHARELRRLRKLGVEPKAPSASSKPGTQAKKTETNGKPGERLAEPPPTSKNGKAPSLDDTRAARIAAARRMSEQQRRGVV
jgi:hypothetical protein